MTRRRIGLAIVAGALLLAGLADRPHADIVVAMHEQGDPAPQRMQAAFDVGVMAVSVLFTWSHARTRY